MNKLLNSALTLFFMVPSSMAMAAIPVTPLSSVYITLFEGQQYKAWDQLNSTWPALKSEIQRREWVKALRMLVSQQCGNNSPINTPEWLDEPVIEFIQRDIPLNRIYKIRMKAKTSHQELKIRLVSPSGRNLLEDTQLVFTKSNHFYLESKDYGVGFEAGIYELEIINNTDTWKIKISFQGTDDINWVNRINSHISTRRPKQPLVCPTPWVEQRILSLPNYEDVWFKQTKIRTPLRWPYRKDAKAFWASISVVRSEARGGLTLHFVHRFAGPLSLISQ